MTWAWLLGAQLAIAAPSTYTLEPARLTDGAHIALPPMAVAPSAPAADRRPLYIGGGLVVLAAAMWWNRRRRDELDRADRSTRGEAPLAGPGATDDDGDDLHAAARDEASKDET